MRTLVDAALKARLLASIESNRLVLLCGAGLSMAAPSNLPSARVVARHCFDEYTTKVDPHCPAGLRDNLETLAEHFVEAGLLPYFISELVPWEFFVKPPNPGHAAIADFLTTGAVFAALSANYDVMIEDYARTHRADLIASLDGDEANQVAHKHSPLLKFHGCATKDRSATVWSKSQLDIPPVANRIAKTKTWLAANMREKDLVVVGFWSDWAHLNDVFSGALENTGPRSVVVVDPSEVADLQSKAPTLWAIAHAAGTTFEHVKGSGADFLAELRLEFSRSYMRQVLAAGRATYEHLSGTPCEPGWLQANYNDNEELYHLRCDSEGTPAPGPAKNKAPPALEMVGLFHLLLRKAGATQVPGGYALAGRSIRVVNGAHRAVGTVQAAFQEPPAGAPSFDVVACVGAQELSLPGHVLRPGVVGSVMHPAASGLWLSFDQARTELAV